MCRLGLRVWPIKGGWVAPHWRQSVGFRILSEGVVSAGEAAILRSCCAAMHTVNIITGSRRSSKSPLTSREPLCIVGQPNSWSGRFMWRVTRRPTDRRRTCLQLWIWKRATFEWGLTFGGLDLHKYLQAFMAIRPLSLEVHCCALVGDL